MSLSKLTLLADSHLQFLQLEAATQGWSGCREFNFNKFRRQLNSMREVFRSNSPGSKTHSGKRDVASLLDPPRLLAWGNASKIYRGSGTAQRTRLFQRHLACLNLKHGIKSNTAPWPRIAGGTVEAECFDVSMGGPLYLQQHTGPPS